MSECPFCDRIATRDVERIYPADRVVRFEPLNPVTPGHRLFVPMDHTEHMEGREASTATGTAMAVAQDYGVGACLDFNLVTSSGSAATQTVPHIHIHYVPRRVDDGLHLPWTGQRP